MKKLSLSFLLVAAALLLAVPASAKDLNGRFAIGGARTLLGSSGLSAKYYAGHLGVGLIAGFQTHKAEQAVEGGTGDNVDTNTNLSLRVSFNAARAKDTNFILGGGFTFATYGNQTPTGDETNWNEMGLEFFIGAEHFFGNHFALVFEAGVPIRLISADEGGAIAILDQGPAGKGSWVDIGRISPTLMSGFHFYF